MAKSCKYFCYMCRNKQLFLLEHFHLEKAVRLYFFTHLFFIFFQDTNLKQNVRAKILCIFNIITS